MSEPSVSTEGELDALRCLFRVCLVVGAGIEFLVSGVGSCFNNVLSAGEIILDFP